MRYDSTSIPERYHDARALAPDDLRYWVSLVEQVLPPEARGVVIDVGCGTGRFSVPLAEHLGVPVVGIDPSRRMLEEAGRSAGSPRVTYREGSAEAIPVEAGSVALVFMSNAFHHVRDLDQALRELARVLVPGGIVFLRNYSRENLDSLDYLRFFPEALTVSRAMLWPRGRLVEAFTARAFALVAQRTVRQEAAPDFEAYVAKIRSRVYSDLALIPDEAFHRGMAELEGDHRSGAGGPVMEELDCFVFRR